LSRASAGDATAGEYVGGADAARDAADDSRFRRRGRTLPNGVLPNGVARPGVINFALHDFAPLFAASAPHPFFAGEAPQSRSYWLEVCTRLW
jgi:hypothetical protein